MNISKITQKKIDKYEKKGSISKLIKIITAYNYEASEAEVKVQESARKAIVRIGTKSVPLLKKAINKQLLLHCLLDTISGVLHALYSLEEHSLLNNIIIDFIKNNSTNLWMSKDKDILFCIEILEKREVTSSYYEPFLWILFQGIIDYSRREDHIQTIQSVLKILDDNSWKPKNDKEKLIYQISVLVDDKLLAEGLGALMGNLGWDREKGYYTEREWKDPEVAIYQYNNTKKYLEDNNRKKDAYFLESSIKPLIYNAFLNTVAINIYWYDLFNTFDISKKQLDYSHPNCCPGCLNEVTVSNENFSIITEDDGNKQSFVTISLPFCRLCKKIKDSIVETGDDCIIFHNVYYGRLFAKVNKLNSYYCYYDEKYRSVILSSHLEKMGIQDMTNGIPKDQVKF